MNKTEQEKLNIKDDKDKIPPCGNCTKCKWYEPLGFCKGYCIRNGCEIDFATEPRRYES